MTFLTVLRSEVTKMASLRSTRWTLLALGVATIGFGALVANGVSSDPVTRAAADFDPVAISLAGLHLGLLATAVLGVLTMSGEYANGAIRTTFTAVPRRGTVLAAKAVLIGVVGLLFGWISSFAAFFVCQPLLHSYGVHVSVTGPHVLRALIGGGILVAAAGLYGLGCGALLRRTAGAITVAIVSLLVLPGLTLLLPGAWGAVVYRYFTTNAGEQIIRVVQGDGYLGPWSGYLIFTAWWVILLALAALLLRRRDA
jgi:hypothetical protein